MSKASRQSISLLAIVSGVFITMDSFQLAPELAPTIDWGRQVCDDCIKNYPETGDYHKNLKWMEGRLKEIDKDLNNRHDIYSMIVLTSIASHIMEDLIEMIKNKYKLSLLEPVYEAVQGLSDQIDPKKDCFDAYEEADNLLNKIYERLGFVR